MGLFEKKYCDFCGEKIGLLGNRKLADGNMCKDCAKQISPFLTGRKSFTVDEMKEHLEYREENKKRVESFNPTKVIGSDMPIYFDEDKKQWIITGDRKWRDKNPDVLDYSQVTGCDLDINEDRREEYRTNDQGESVSYVPPRYTYHYDFNMTIHVNSPWFDRICFRLNSGDIEGRSSGAYSSTEADANEIKAMFAGVREESRKAAAPKQASRCPNCGATCIPDANGCCEYCGGPM